MAAGYNFAQELRNVTERNPNFDIRLLLPMMVAKGIIDHQDRAIVQNCHHPIEATNILAQIMSAKDMEKQNQFYGLLQQQGVLNLGATEEFQQFLFHLSDNFPSFDVKFLLSRLAAQLIINMQEKAIIEHSATPADAANILFLHYLPLKGQQLQQRFVNLLRKNNMTTLADNLGPLIDRFYAPQQIPAEPAPAPPQPQHPPPPVPQPVNQPQPPPRQVQPVNPLPAASPFLNVEAIQTLHTTQAYKIEYQALIDAIGQVPDTAGQIPINIQPLTSEPMDLTMNRYYGKNGKRWALLINNYKYDNLPDHLTKNRKGSLVDYDNMKSLLEALGYKVVGKQDRKAQEMMDDVTEFATDMAKEGDIHSCVVVVMTHGEQGWFIGTDNIPLDQRQFFKVITENTALVGKPKICIIQACRGSKINLGAMSPDAIVPAIAEEEADAASMTKIAAGADTCILYSTTPGYFSWRNHTKGSWFIQAICQEFSGNVHQPWADLLTLSVRVTGELAESFRTVPIRNAQGGYNFYDVVQLPTMEVNMRKKFHFFAGLGQEHKTTEPRDQ